ncbi:hypothetical protein RW1_009_00950 [Rhodococcus wratislaviensis NBRC 100605]|uniref:Uncharacterized protein n=1 Tax=Rhodococcus wratislaviensis NBRC 100605 TaxID=1219028 RepID=X0Q0J7_RHOWR|nr:hypothetical protein RW1_009_00950 [Rhodococcus wratislaviensis NBRC 100605]
MLATRLTTLAGRLGSFIKWTLLPQYNYAHFDFSYGEPIDQDQIACEHKEVP